MSNLNVKIEGMSCNNCVRHVTEALEELEGVTGVQVNLEQKYALVTPAEISQDAIKAAVEEAGYEVTGISAE